jgi:hypothetical protein
VAADLVGVTVVVETVKKTSSQRLEMDMRALRMMMTMMMTMRTRSHRRASMTNVISRRQQMMKQT